MSANAFYRFIASIVLAALSARAQATYTCSGAVKGVSIEPTSGDVLAESIGTSMNWPRFCSLRQDSNGITTAGCKAVYASLLTAQASGRSVTVWVNGPSASCAALSSWQFVEGFYFLRIDG